MDERTNFRIWRGRLILAAILTAALLLRLHRLGGPSLWFDEQASVMSSTGHFADWQNMPLDRVIESPPDLSSVRNENSLVSAWRSPDSHPPLYAVLLRFWREVVGESDGRTRALSVLASLAAIVLLYDVGCTLADQRVALWACAIMAVAQPQIQYAQEARGYALWSALGIAACAAAARLAVRGPGWRRALALGACLCLMMLTHFLAVGCAIGLLVWCGIYLRGRGLKQMASAVVGAIVILSFVGLELGSQAYSTQHNTDWLHEATAGHIGHTLWRAALLPSQFLADPTTNAQFAAVAAAVLYILPWLLPGRLPKLCGMWLVGGVGLVFVIDLLTGTAALSLIRFTLVAVPAVYLLIAALPLRGMGRHLLPLAAVVCALMAVPDDYQPYWKLGQWRELGGDVRRLSHPGDVVVFASLPDLFLLDPRKLYEGTRYYAQPIPCPVLLLDGKIDPMAEQGLRKATHVLVVFPDGAGTLRHFLPGWTFAPAAPKRRYCGTVWWASSTIR